MKYTLHDSPLGELLLAGGSGGLQRLGFRNGPHREAAPKDWLPDPAPFVEVARQLDAYFAGSLETFDLPLAPTGSPFQQLVWRELRAIPYGSTISYRELAVRVGKPNAARAVGAANGANPIPVIIPCHRVVGADGSLTGYGGGLEIKERLLAHEGALLRF